MEYREACYCYADWSGVICEDINNIKCEISALEGYKDTCKNNEFGYISDYDGSPPCNIIEGDEVL